MVKRYSRNRSSSISTGRQKVMEVRGVETVQPVLKRGRDVWDRINMPEIEFRQRVEKIIKQMKAENIDLLLAYGHGQNDYGNPSYITNYMLKTLRGAFAVITAKGEVTLFIRIADRDIEAAKLTTWVEDVRPCSDVAKECVAFLKDNGLVPATVGFAGLNRLLPNYQLEFVSKTLEQCKIVDADHILRDMRMVKSQRECDQIRRAARIVSHAFKAITEFDLAEGNELVLEAGIDREARLAGAEDVRILFAKPNDKKWAFRPPENDKILRGEKIIIYLAIEFERYWSEGVRTFQLTDASYSQINSDSSMEMYEKMVSGIISGKSLSEFYKEIVARLKEGNCDYVSEFGFGHGIGLSPSEPPAISADDRHSLKEGMLFTFRIAMKDEKAGTVMIGNTLQVINGGVEILTE